MRKDTVRDFSSLEGGAKAAGLPKWKSAVWTDDVPGQAIGPAAPLPHFAGMEPSGAGCL